MRWFAMNQAVATHVLPTEDSLPVLDELLSNADRTRSIRDRQLTVVARSPSEAGQAVPLVSAPDAANAAEGADRATFAHAEPPRSGREFGMKKLFEFVRI